MDMSTRRIGQWVFAALIATIVTQIVYMALLGGPTAADPAIGVTQADRMRYFDERWGEIAAVWLTELVAFIILFMAASAALAQRAPAPFGWSALALSAIANIIQIAIGLAMFRPATAAGAELEALSTLVVEAAFFFYFLAKLLIGVGGIAFGTMLFNRATGAARGIGGAAVAVGLAAAIVNLLALPQRLDWVFAAGAIGTVAALTTGLAALSLSRSSPSAG